MTLSTKMKTFQSVNTLHSQCNNFQHCWKICIHGPLYLFFFSFLIQGVFMRRRIEVRTHFLPKRHLRIFFFFDLTKANEDTITQTYACQIRFSLMNRSKKPQRQYSGLQFAVRVYLQNCGNYFIQHQHHRQCLR